MTVGEALGKTRHPELRAQRALEGIASNSVATFRYQSYFSAASYPNRSSSIAVRTVVPPNLSCAMLRASPSPK